MELVEWITGRLASSLTSREHWHRIKNNDPSLHPLDVLIEPDDPPQYGPLIQDADIANVGRDISNFTHPMEISLVGSYQRVDEARRKFLLFCEGIHHNKSVEKLYLNTFSPLDDEMIQSISPFLQSSSSNHNNILQRLEISNCEWNLEGIQSLVAALASRESPLEELHLTECQICDDLVGAIFVALGANPAMTPKKIGLNMNNFGQCNSIATLLQDQACTLEKLDLSDNQGIDDDSARVLADALEGNASLKELHLGDGTAIKWTGLQALSKSLCNTTTINSTYSSNHTLEILHYERSLSYDTDDDSDQEPDDSHAYYDDAATDLQQYLTWNRNEDKTMVARQKVFMKHFIQNFRIEPFNDMEPDILVRVLHFMLRASAENGGVTNVNARNFITIQLLLFANKSRPCRTRWENHAKEFMSK